MSKNMSRRSFLQGAGAAAAAATMGAGTAFAAGAPVAEDYVISLKNGLPKWSFEIPPAPISDDEIAEVIEDDIIVVGAGMSGMCCAASAAESGASVTLFSASSQPISRGGSNFSAYNKVIEEYGIERLDPVDFFYHEERAASFTIDQQMWMRGYNNSEEAMNWVIDIVRSKEVEVFLESDNRYDNGPDYAIGFGAKGDNSASASTGQQNAVVAMEEYALENGAKIIYDTVAKQLVRDPESGRVTAVIAEKADGSYVKFVANRGIVLATGDFSANKEMIAKYCPQVLPLVGTEDAPTDYNRGFALTGLYPGDGQKMGLWIGAAWQHTSVAPMMQGSWGGSYEPLGFHQGLNVNMNTERYQREDMSSPYSANHLITQPGHRSWGIWTANFAQAIIDAGYEWRRFGARYETTPSTAEQLIAQWDASMKYETIEELAEKCGLDAEKLHAVIDRYNELCEIGEDLDFHKPAQFLIPILPEGPFYATRNSPMVMTVMGGLNTNQWMQVCDEDDQPIPGLFNIGHMTGNMYANNYNFAIPGNCYGINCITYGYLVGKDLAADRF
ncbi:MAG: FAD-dependent oxidoreductase [Coriobacteriales bacterium]|nr:FAD-dependent oxidoreductase [Coriobacteriales bacterium]